MRCSSNERAPRMHAQRYTCLACDSTEARRGVASDEQVVDLRAAHQRLVGASCGDVEALPGKLCPVDDRPVCRVEFL